MHLLNPFVLPESQVQMSDTLVIHASDPSTEFLREIYEDKPYDVIHSSHYFLDKLLLRYDRVIMLGHGWTSGLFSVGQFLGPFAIDDYSAVFLEGKSNVYIWCMASTFVQQHRLRGFSSGMFISEVGEAAWFNIHASQEQIDHSNHLFTGVIKEQIEAPNLSRILEVYDGDCPVIQYNRAQLRLFV